ncbi:MAG: hypothetical protein AB1403_17410, partial [Candidatus Riflebacteria bacterium]
MSKTFITFKAPEIKEEEEKPGCGCGCSWSTCIFLIIWAIMNHLIFIKDVPVTSIIALALAWYVHRLFMNKIGHSKENTPVSNNQCPVDY